MQQDLSPSVGRIADSMTVAINGRILAMKRAGMKVMSLSGGEPDFDTPSHVKAAAISAIRSGDTKYSAVDGTVTLKQAIARKFERDNYLNYSVDSISVGAGGKQVIFNALVSSIEPADEVIIPQPCWTSYPEIVKFAGGTPVTVKTTEATAFKLTPRMLELAITPRTRWFILNSPCNPTGATYSLEELKSLGEVLAAHPRVLVLADDIYEHLVYDKQKFVTIAQAAPFLFDRTLTVNGVSKAFGMTGWRIGYAGGPRWLINGMARLQGHSTGNPCNISQAAAVAALDGPQELLLSNLETYSAGRRVVVDALNQVTGISCHEPQGAFYAYPSVAGLIGKKAPSGKRIANDLELAAYILDEAGVTVVPGSAFGLSPYVRVSFSARIDSLRTGCSLLASACARLAD